MANFTAGRMRFAVGRAPPLVVAKVTRGLPFAALLVYTAEKYQMVNSWKSLTVYFGLNKNEGNNMGEEQKGGRIVRSGLALTLAGTLMVPSTAAFAADGDDQAQQPSATSAVEQAMQQAQANGTDAQGNVTIIVQLEDGGSQGVSLFSRIMGTVKQSRHSYFKDQIRSMVNEEQAQGIALLSAEDADDASGDATQEQQPEFQEL